MAWHVSRSTSVITISLIACCIAFRCSEFSFAQSIEWKIDEVERAIANGDVERAKKLIDARLSNAPNDSQALFSLARVTCLLDDEDAAASALFQAFQAGFRDFETLRTDESVASLRNHPIYQRILEQADNDSKTLARQSLDEWRSTYSTEKYHYEFDSDQRTHFVVSLNEAEYRKMRTTLNRLRTHLIDSFFQAEPDDEILIVLPTRRDARQFFAKDNSIGGMYKHDRRRLVARNADSSLTHEYFHAMHYGHMERIKQKHAWWIQEGFASLYEDYEITDDGSLVVFPNERQTIVQNRARANRLIAWNDMFAMSAQEFMNNPKRMYPQVRSMFEYLSENDVLTEWYRKYVANFDDDQTGRKAFELVFQLSIEEVEGKWKMWIAEQNTTDHSTTLDEILNESEIVH